MARSENKLDKGRTKMATKASNDNCQYSHREASESSYQSSTRIYSQQSLNLARISIEDQQIIHYMINVLRLKIGDIITCFNSADGEHLMRIVGVTKKKQIELENLLFDPSPKKISPLNKEQCNKAARLKSNAKRHNSLLFFSPFKREDPTFIAEKSTELNIDAIIPIITDRSIVSKVRFDKMKSSIIHAAEQSGRITLPKLYFKTSKTLPNSSNIIFDPYIEQFDIDSSALYILSRHDEFLNIYHDISRSVQKDISHVFVIFDPRGNFSPASIKDAILRSDCSRQECDLPDICISLFFGPEGGLSNDDTENIHAIANALSAKVINLRIAQNILRAETAIIAGLGIIEYLLEALEASNASRTE